MVFLKDVFRKVNFEEKNQQTTKSIQNHPACNLLNLQLLMHACAAMPVSSPAISFTNISFSSKLFFLAFSSSVILCCCSRRVWVALRQSWVTLSSPLRFNTISCIHLVLLLCLQAKTCAMVVCRPTARASNVNTSWVVFIFAPELCLKRNFIISKRIWHSQRF